MKKYFQLVLLYINNIDEEKIFEISFLIDIKCSLYDDFERVKYFLSIPIIRKNFIKILKNLMVF